MKIFVPNSAHLGNIEGFLRHFDPSNDSTLSVEFHPKWVSVHPLVLSMVACVGQLARLNGISLDVKVPEMRSLPYLIRMGLFDHLGVSDVPSLTEHESSGRFIPITQVRSNDDLKNFMIDMVPLLHCEPSEADTIKYVISEMVRNVLEHSNSPVGAFVCAQYFQKSNRLAIGVADAGNGVLKTMGIHRPKDAAEALNLALRPGVTGTTLRRGGTEYNAGAGLFFVKSIAATGRQFFVLLSDGAMFKLRTTPSSDEVTLHPDPKNDISTWREELPAWPGTAVGIDISVDSGASFRDLLNEIRETYSLDVKAAKKAKFKKARFS